MHLHEYTSVEELPNVRVSRWQDDETLHEAFEHWKDLDVLIQINVIPTQKAEIHGYSALVWEAEEVNFVSYDGEYQHCETFPRIDKKLPQVEN